LAAWRHGKENFFNFTFGEKSSKFSFQKITDLKFDIIKTYGKEFQVEAQGAWQADFPRSACSAFHTHYRVLHAT
jgi:hypothetical protein